MRQKVWPIPTQGLRCDSTQQLTRVESRCRRKCELAITIYIQYIYIYNIIYCIIMDYAYYVAAQENFEM